MFKNSAQNQNKKGASEFKKEKEEFIKNLTKEIQQVPMTKTKVIEQDHDTVFNENKHDKNYQKENNKALIL